MSERICTLAADQDLVNRVRTAFRRRADPEEKKMSGGITFRFAEKCASAWGRDRIKCRVDPGLRNSFLEREGRRNGCDEMATDRGFVYADARVLKTQRELEYWIALSLDYNKRTSASTRKRRS